MIAILYERYTMLDCGKHLHMQQNLFLFPYKIQSFYNSQNLNDFAYTTLYRIRIANDTISYFTFKFYISRHIKSLRL